MPLELVHIDRMSGFEIRAYAPLEPVGTPSSWEDFRELGIWTRPAVFPPEAELIEVFDNDSRCKVNIWSAFGANCYSAQMQTPSGRPVELLLAPRTPSELVTSPSRFGIPVLFPWCGRIPEARYVWKGQEFRLSDVHNTGLAMHGLVKDARWRAQDFSFTQDSATVSCAIASKDLPKDAGFPWEWELELHYIIKVSELSVSSRIRNRGGEPMPFGFGLHPYFALPLGSRGEAGQCAVQVPAKSEWNLNSIARAMSSSSSRKADYCGRVTLDLNTPTKLEGRKPDAVLTDLAFRSGRVETAVIDQQNGVRVSVEFGEEFPNLVVFTPQAHAAVCLEPWTCPPNVFSLAERIGTQSGVMELPPGGEWTSCMTMRLSDLA